MNKMTLHTARHNGAAMVELALLLPILLFLVFGITEMGRALYQQSILTKATDSGVRLLSRSYNTIDKENGCAELANWEAAQDDASNLVTYGDVDGGDDALLDGLTVTSIDIESRDLQDYDKQACIIILRAEAPFTPVITDTLYGFPTFNLKATAEQRYIGE